MQKLKKAAGSALIYAGFLGGGIAACFADSAQHLGTYAALMVGCCIAVLAGVALRGN